MDIMKGSMGKEMMSFGDLESKRPAMSRPALGRGYWGREGSLPDDTSLALGFPWAGVWE